MMLIDELRRAVDECRGSQPAMAALRRRVREGVEESLSILGATDLTELTEEQKREHGEARKEVMDFMEESSKIIGGLYDHH